MTPRLAAEAEIKGYGVSLKIPLPKWAVTGIAAVIVVGLVGVGAYLAKTYLVDRIAVPIQALNEYKEVAKHSTEPTEQRVENIVTFPDTTRVTVIHHPSDGCDQIVRWIPAKQKGESRWIFGPGLTPEKQALAVAPDASILNLVRRASIVPDRSSSEGAGGCLNPHPGRFTEQSQPAGQCVTKVFRYFEDGCYHYQLYNPCSGTWDVTANGAPRVYWQRCIH